MCAVVFRYFFFILRYAVGKIDFNFLSISYSTVLNNCAIDVYTECANTLTGFPDLPWIYRHLFVFCVYTSTRL